MLKYYDNIVICIKCSKSMVLLLKVICDDFAAPSE